MAKEPLYRLADTAYTAIIRGCLLSPDAQTDIPFGDLTLSFDTQEARRDFYGLSDRKRVATVFPDYSEFMDAESPETMTLKEILLYDRLWGEGHKKTGYFGIPWETLVGEFGCEVARRSFFEAKPWEIATSFARTLRQEAVRRRNISPSHPLRLLDVCTGTGVTALALSAPTDEYTPAHVASLESNGGICKFTCHSLDSMGVARVTPYWVNALDFLPSAARAEMHYDGAFLDPPWGGVYARTEMTVDDLCLTDTNGYIVSGPDLVDLALQVSPVVAIHVPSKISPESMYASAKRIGAQVTITEHHAHSGGRKLKEILALFHR
ncbi:MAG: hypothetical protein UY10_C0007G0002 [Microgenomates group bacterium GW2011_GWA2_47_8]|nr:MAG: hypothetical protein UY10_C0007G0002 [Microgenomates group bacterium GW2011_GWA2_47_8]